MNNLTGTIRFIDSAHTQTCLIGETLEYINAAGIQGVPGPPGPQGPPGQSPPSQTVFGVRTVETTGFIPAGTGTSSPVYHQENCPTNYILLSASGYTQVNSNPAMALIPLSYTPSGNAGTDDEASYGAIFVWSNPSSSDLGYQIFLVCAQRTS